MLQQFGKHFGGDASQFGSEGALTALMAKGLQELFCDGKIGGLEFQGAQQIEGIALLGRGLKELATELPGLIEATGLVACQGTMNIKAGCVDCKR